jgi:hypothetical protein
MSLVALTLNLTLGLLLAGAMILGLRLDRRLRALRESHQSFAKAVSELDQAAQRTQAGLNELRETAESVRTDLAARIDSARTLSDLLIKLTNEADAKAEGLSKAQAAAAAAAPAATAPLRSAFLRPVAESQSAPAPAPALSARSRASVDDELFETSLSKSPQGGLAALAGGRR